MAPTVAVTPVLTGLSGLEAPGQSARSLPDLMHDPAAPPSPGASAETH